MSVLLQKRLRDNGTLEVKLMFHDDDGHPLEPVRTKQEFLEESDINNLINRYKRNGIDVNSLSGIEGTYADVTQLGDYSSVQARILQAKEIFDGFPAKVRKYFGYDHVAFMDAYDNPEMRDDLKMLGFEFEDSQTKEVPSDVQKDVKEVSEESEQ